MESTLHDSQDLLEAREDVLQARAHIFRALGNEKRLRIFQALVEADGPLHVSAICERTGLSATLASHHLQCLTNCTLAEVTQEGRKRFYEVRLPEAVEMVRLADACIRQDFENVLECDVVAESCEDDD